MFHGEQCESCVGICLWIVSSGRQLSAPLTICFVLQIVSSLFRYGVVYYLATYVPVWHQREIRIPLKTFGDEWVTSRRTIYSFVNKLKRPLIGKKQKHERRVLTEEKLGDIGARNEHTLRKWLKRLAPESVKRATQLLKLRHCKTRQGVQIICYLLCSFLQPPATSSLLSPNVLLSTLFSKFSWYAIMHLVLTASVV
jgi:hypothetical protein